MKKFLTPLLATTFAFSAAALCAQENPSKPERPPQDPPAVQQQEAQPADTAAATVEGTITQIEDGRSFVVRDASNVDTVIFWDASTKLVGPETNTGTTTERSGQTTSSMSGLKVGDNVVVKTTEQGDKKVAASVQIVPKKS
jgi:hypothetical protein